MLKSISIDEVGTILFAMAVLHTFLVKRFQHWAGRFKSGSIMENFLHLLGEVEIVFGFWAGLLLVFMAISQGPSEALFYLETLTFTEPIFVFVIMVISASRPILILAEKVLFRLSCFLPLPHGIGYFMIVLTIGPMLASLITEPAAMTVVALLMKQKYFDKISLRLKYLSLGVLFVNISIGGVGTDFAAPPVLMVAKKWDWDSYYMFFHFGWKAFLAIQINTTVLCLLFWKELSKIHIAEKGNVYPYWIMFLHLLFLGLTVSLSHHAVAFVGLFLFFLGVATITREYQHELKLRESLLVAFFLSGLVVFGQFQRWWLEPLLLNLGEGSLFLGATILTSFTDNAALTYLGAQVPRISEAAKYALLSGAVAGGGLTVIANAPNPAGFSILKSSFGEEGISPLGLFISALVPTLIGMACLWFLP